MGDTVVAVVTLSVVSKKASEATPTISSKELQLDGNKDETEECAGGEET